MNKLYVITFCIFLVIHTCGFAQPNLSFDLKKPPKFENKTLGSEKTATKKFTVTRRFVQNTVTHYNYYFNANNRLNEIIERARQANRDDYTKLLPFYDYSLKGTAAFKGDLDSVIYKSTAGVLIHDLRNDWIDNLYILIGKAYYLRNELDSAFLTFQYINYAFSPKEKDGYDKVIGSNQEKGNNAFSISTKENPNIVKRVFSEPPSRNESLVWQIRTYLAKDELAEAAGLIETLKNDPRFPSRLDADLEEVQALWFYKQQAYDSAAVYLERCLDNASGKQEQARWEYLIAQLYELSGKSELAEKFYNRAIQHTIDPLMEVYARLNSIRQKKEGNEKGIQSAIDELIKMARRDKYLFYRDIVYYTAATIELERKNPEAAIAHLLRSVRFSTNNPAQKSQSFFALGNIYFDQKKYVPAKIFYDSVLVQTFTPEEAKGFGERKSALDQIYLYAGVVERQDSLRRVAAMPEAERTAYIKKLVRQLRKQQGIREDGSGLAEGSGFTNNNNTGPVDLFGSNSGKGDWYFYNASLKGKGFSEFKAKWGTRPNADNWRRQAAVTPANAVQVTSPGLTGQGPLVQMGPVEISEEALSNNLPITPEKIKISNDSSEYSYFELGRAYMSGLEDYLSAITAYEKLLSTYPATNHAEEAWFNLYYCYLKTGNRDGQAHVKQVLAAKFPSGKYLALLNNPDPSRSPASIQKTKATKQYDEIYTLFIEGKFREALARKKQADSIYGQTYWTPQLLYIEAVYHIRQREDSTAKVKLATIMQLYPSSPMFPKTANLLAVLNRRKEIEDYLTRLEIQRPEEDAPVLIADNFPKKKAPPVVPEKSPPKAEVEPAAPAGVSQQSPPKAEVEPEVTPAVVSPDKEANAAVVRQNNVPVPKAAINDKLLRPAADSLNMVKRPPVVNSVYVNNPAEPHYVALVLDKVDPVYATEARNAFNRYNRERYSGKTIEIIPVSLSDDTKLVLLKNFENAAEALDYIEKARKLASIEIIPWLTAQKYSFVMISDPNLELLKTTKNVPAYTKFLNQLYPGLFQ